MDSYFRNNISELSHMIGIYDSVSASVFFTIKPKELTYTYTPLVPTITTYNNTTGALALVSGTSYTLTYTSFEIDMGAGSIVTLQNCEYRVVSINSNTGVVALTLISGTPVVGTIDISKFIKERNNFTLNFNEAIGAFESFHSFNPELYIRIPQGFISSANKIALYYHNKGLRGSYYGTVYPSFVEMLYTDSGVELLEFNNLEFFSEVSKPNVNYKNETLDTIQVFNEYQVSDEVVLYPMSDTRYNLDSSATRILSTVFNFATLSNIRKSVEHWRTGIPRTLNSESDFDRMRSSNFRMKLDYNNIGDKRFVLHTLITTAQDMII